MSHELPPVPRERTMALSPDDTQRLREVRERLKRLERELRAMPARRRSGESR